MRQLRPSWSSSTTGGTTWERKRLDPREITTQHPSACRSR
uniref:Uncharacterized protein n=1 Tax=Arundo donax TaxID=35708 RepID=A0A0A9BPQ9_ARUDO